MSYHNYCDRCGEPYTASDNWPRNPLCSACLIGTRRAETCDAWPRLITAREIDDASRRAAFRHWNNEISA